MVILSLGSNLGDRRQYLSEALHVLCNFFGKPLAVSSVYDTEPVGVDGHENYLNLVVCYQTAKTPEEVFEIVQKTEYKLGRVRSNTAIAEPRTIDIDILFYDDKIMETEHLVIPHPRLAFRKFVLVPMNEILSEFIHPVSRKSIRELLNECPDDTLVIKSNVKLLYDEI